MLKTRIIPTLLVKDLGLVKGEGFDSSRRIGTVLPAVKVYNRRHVDELVILDIAATLAGRETDIGEIEQIAGSCFVPLTVGGGIKTLDHVKALLRAGADKVLINSAAYDTPGLITEVAESFGVQCVVAGIDAMRDADGTAWCYSHCGTKKQDVTPADWARRVEEAGAGEILITSIPHDGKMEGYDLALIKEVSDAVSIPVIAAGGAGSYDDFLKAVREAGAQAVSASAMYQFTQATPLEAKTMLTENGILVRKALV